MIHALLIDTEVHSVLFTSEVFSVHSCNIWELIWIFHLFSALPFGHPTKYLHQKKEKDKT